MPDTYRLFYRIVGHVDIQADCRTNAIKQFDEIPWEELVEKAHDVYVGDAWILKDEGGE